jgi:hypothetical protein
MGHTGVPDCNIAVVGVDKKTANPEMAAEFLKFLFTGKYGVQYANSVPAQLRSPNKSVRDVTLADTSNPLVKAHLDWWKTFYGINAAIEPSGPMGYMATGEYKPYAGSPCPWGSQAWGTNPIDMQMMQKIVLTGMSIRDGQAWAVDQYKGIVKDYKNKHPNWKPSV